MDSARLIATAHNSRNLFADVGGVGRYDRCYRRRDDEAWAGFYCVPFREPHDRLSLDRGLLSLACTAARRCGACIASNSADLPAARLIHIFARGRAVATMRLVLAPEAAAATAALLRDGDAVRDVCFGLEPASRASSASAAYADERARDSSVSAAACSGPRFDRDPPRPEPGNPPGSTASRSRRRGGRAVVEAGEVRVNRAPVLTLWAAVVAERLGHAPDAAITFGRAVAESSARAKARSIGLDEGEREGDGSEEAKGQKRRPAPARTVRLLGRDVPVAEVEGGVRALDRGEPASPGPARAYVERAFGGHLPAVRRAMERLAASLDPAELNRVGFRLYERFRPEVPARAPGWGRRASSPWPESREPRIDAHRRRLVMHDRLTPPPNWVKAVGRSGQRPSKALSRAGQIPGSGH